MTMWLVVYKLSKLEDQLISSEYFTDTLEHYNKCELLEK